MRILRLDLGGDIGTIDLHPFVSVLHDFHPAQNEALIDAIRSLVNGSGEGISGLVENAGHLIELNANGPDPVGPLTTEDVVVRVDKLAVGALGDPGALVAELDQVRRAADIDAVYVEEIRADLKPSVAAQVQRLRDQLDGIAGIKQNAELEGLERLRGVLATAKDVPPTLREIPEEVRDLIGAWDQYTVVRDKAQPRLDELRDLVQRADGALARAQADAIEAKAGAKPVLLTSEEDARLEELAHPTIERRGRKPKSVSPEEEAELASILGKIGVPTYTAYAMYRLNPTPTPEKMAEVQLADDRVVAAQVELDEARAALEIDPVATDLNWEFDQVKAKAREHLGPMLPTDLGGALAKLVVETENPDFIDALRDLYDIAEAESVPFPDNLDPAQLPDAVANWIAHREGQLLGGEVIDEAAVTAELERAEAALDRHARAMGRIDRLEAKASESTGRVRELEEQIERVTTGANLTAESVIDAIGPLIERVQGENEGSVPLVLEGQFADLDDDQVELLMGQLEAVAQHHQMVLLTNRRRAATWASNAGLRRALRCTSPHHEDTLGFID